MLADALDMEVGFPAGHEGSSFGAALLGMQALGLVDGIEVAESLVRVEEVVAPEERAREVYRALGPLFAGLYDALVPAYAELRRLGPLLEDELGDPGRRRPA
jgi:gluconokinase